MDHSNVNLNILFASILNTDIEIKKIKDNNYKLIFYNTIITLYKVRSDNPNLNTQSSIFNYSEEEWIKLFEFNNINPSSMLFIKNKKYAFIIDTVEYINKKMIWYISTTSIINNSNDVLTNFELGKFTNTEINVNNLTIINNQSQPQPQPQLETQSETQPQIRINKFNQLVKGKVKITKIDTFTFIIKFHKASDFTLYQVKNDVNNANYLIENISSANWISLYNNNQSYQPITIMQRKGKKYAFTIINAELINNNMTWIVSTNTILNSSKILPNLNNNHFGKFSFVIDWIYNTNIAPNIINNSVRLRTYSKIHTNITSNISTGQYYYVNNLVSIYSIPTPILTSPYVVGVVSFGGGLFGDVTFNSNGTGIMSPTDTTSDIYNYWKSIGISSNNLPTVIIQLLDGATNDITDLGSTGENTLDVETIGGCCPSSKLIIILYIGPNSLDQFATTLLYMINTPVIAYDISYKPNCVSISWGAPEIDYGSILLTSINKIMGTLINAGINICVASGDNGSSDGLSGKNVDFPSSSPNCTAVGGTSLYCSPVNKNFNYTNPGTNEITWSGSGGGISSFFSKPNYQSIITSKYRNSPDIALNADPNNGIYYIVGGSLYIFGGTSCSAPIFAGFLAATNTKIFINPLIYSNRTLFYDISSGNNGAYKSIIGYDNCTGCGSLNGTLFTPKILYQPTNITLTSSTTTLYTTSPNNNTQITATVIPNNATQTVTWLSSNSSIATVNSSGLVTAVAVGTVIITAKSTIVSSVTQSLTFNIYTHSILVSPSKITISLSNTVQPISLIATLGNTENSNIVTWSSSNTNYAIIGSIINLANKSTAKIMCKSNGKNKTVNITAQINNKITSSCVITIKS